MSRSEGVLAEIAERLWQAERERRPVAPLTTSHPDLTVEDAYGIQSLNASRGREQGRRLSGYKVGLTSREAQRQFGVFEPDFGHLFSDMEISDSGEVALDELIQPKIEAEIAFVLGRELRGPGVSLGEVLRAVEFATAAIEIVDSRIENWKIRAADTIADNGSSARYALAPCRVPLDGLDLGTVGMALSRGDEVVVTGAGAAVVGGPLEAVRFLANALGARGESLLPGQVVLSGALSAMLPLEAGVSYRAEIWKLGSVSLRGVETGTRHPGEAR